MIVYSATELLKAGHKYTRKWRGKDGNWNYDYGPKRHATKQGREGVFGQKYADAIRGGGGGSMQLQSGEGFKPSLKADGTGPYKDGTGPKCDDGSCLELHQNDVSYESSSQAMRDTAMAYKDTVPSPVKINAKIRNRLNKVVSAAFPGNYYDHIPLSEINDSLKTEGFILLQEDNTEWAGMLTGDNAEAFFNLGDLSSGRMVNGMMTYAMVENSGLRMTWYKMNSNKYEVIKYIT